MARIFATVGLIAGLAWASSAQAAVVYSQPWDGGSNLIASQNDTTGGNGNFATTFDNFNLSSSSLITDVAFTGGYFNPPSQGTITAFTLKVYSDNSGVPGAEIYSVTVNNTANETFVADVNGFPIYTYDIPTSFIAAAGTEYWLSVVPDLGFPPQWGWATGTGGDSAGYQCFFGACSAGGNDFAFTLNSGRSIPAPEPLTLSLFGAGLAGAVAMRRRRMQVR
jgi:PEP-CTERM motif